MYELAFSPFPVGEPIIVHLDAETEAAAKRAAREAIAERLGKSGAFVHLDANGCFSAGAGCWNRNGRYTLTPRDRETFQQP